MAGWVPDDRDEFDRPAADIAAMFADAERRLVAMVALQVRAGLDAGDDPVKALRITDLRALADQLVAALREIAPEQAAELMTTAQERGTAAALRELAGLAGAADAAAAFSTGGALAASMATADLSSTLDDVALRILRFPDDVYRRAVGQSVTDALLGMGTNRSAQARAWQQLVTRGVIGFVDKANRRWNLATYVEMATRTAARRAWDDQHAATMAEHGITLVSLIVGSDACKRCADWSGKVLRTDAGPTGRIRVPSAVGDGDVVVTVAGTLDEAKHAGWRHPNCRCRIVAYLPGLSVVEDATTYDSELEGQREKLRDLERKVRKAKIEESAAVTPESKKRARATRLDLQRRITSHVADTGLNRKRYREQISLGRVLLPDGPAAS